MLSFDFTRIESLNTAQNKLQKIDPNLIDIMHFDLNEKNFSCQYSQKLLSKANQQLMKYKLTEVKSADIVTILRFEQEVKSCKNNKSHISKNGKSVLTKFNASEFIDNPANQSIIVNF